MSATGLLIAVAAVSAISTSGTSDVAIRAGIVMLTVGAALLLPWRLLIPAVVLAWLASNLGRSLVDEAALLNLNMALEGTGLAAIAFFTVMARESLKHLEQENVLIGSDNSDLAGLNPLTGIFDTRQLKPTIQAELARSMRFGRSFALVLVGIDEMRQKFDYRDEAAWRASLDATARLLRQTRNNVDRVFHYKADGFAMVLPESAEKDIPGLVRRLRRLARTAKPAEGEPGGPLRVHFGATFFPVCATTVDDLLRRAEVALRIAAGSTTRYQLDSAEAPELPPAETMRRENAESIAASEIGSVAAARPPTTISPGIAPIVGDGTGAAPHETVETDVASQTKTAIPTHVAEALGPEAPGKKPFKDDATFAEAPVPGLETVVSSLTADAFVPEGPTPEPVLVAAQAATPATVEPPASGHALTAGELEALLKQMDETLDLIRSVRNSAS